VTRLQTALLWLPAAVLAGVMAVVSLLRPSDDLLADLHVYRGAVAGLLHGDSLYDFITSNDAPFTYPPFAGLLFVPFALLPERGLGIGWTVATVAVIVAIAVVATRGRVKAPPRATALPALLAAALFASAPVSSNLRFGQVSVILALLILLDLMVVPEKWRGILIGIAAAVKLTPLIFIPLLWFAGRRRAAIVATSTFAGAAAVAFAILPHDSTRYWFTELAKVNRLGHIATGGNQSFNGMLLRLGLDDTPRTMLTAVVALVVGVLALWRGSRAGRDGDWLTAAVVVGAASVVMSPVSWTHHQIWLVLAALLPVAGPRWWRITWPAVALAVMILPVNSLDALPGGSVVGNLRLYLAVVVACLLPVVRHVPARDASSRSTGPDERRPVDERPPAVSPDDDDAQPLPPSQSIV
jgi:alpha-1,2-mannosyltransferase